MGELAEEFFYAEKLQSYAVLQAFAQAQHEDWPSESLDLIQGCFYENIVGGLIPAVCRLIAEKVNEEANYAAQGNDIDVPDLQYHSRQECELLTSALFYICFGQALSVKDVTEMISLLKLVSNYTIKFPENHLLLTTQYFVLAAIIAYMDVSQERELLTPGYREESPATLILNTPNA